MKLEREAWRLYARLDALRQAEALVAAQARPPSIARLVRLAHLCRKAYLRFERRAAGAPWKGRVAKPK